MKFDFDWPFSFREKHLKIDIHVYSPGAGADNLLDQFFTFIPDWKPFVYLCTFTLYIKPLIWAYIAA